MSRRHKAAEVDKATVEAKEEELPNEKETKSKRTKKPVQSSSAEKDEVEVAVGQIGTFTELKSGQKYPTPSPGNGDR